MRQLFTLRQKLERAKICPKEQQINILNLFITMPLKTLRIFRATNRNQLTVVLCLQQTVQALQIEGVIII